MAITVTDRGTVSEVRPPELLAITSGAFTPAASRLIVSMLTGFQGYTSGAAFTDSDTIADTGGGSWVEDAFTVNTTAEGLARCAHRQLGTAPGTSKTVTTTNTGPHHDVWVQSVIEVAGHNATTPVPSGQHAVQTSTAGNITVGLPNAPDAASLVVCGLCAPNSPAPTTPTGFTTLTSQQLTGDGHNMAYKIGSAPQSVSWTGLGIQTGGFVHSAFIVEFASATGGGGIAVPNFSIADTFADVGGGVWTKLTGITASGAEVAIWCRRIGTGAVSGAVTATAANSTQGRSLSVLQLANRNATDPVPTGQANSIAAVTAALTDSLGATPLADSIMVAGAISRGDASAPGVPAGHTALTNLSTGGDGYEASYVPGNGVQSAAYAGLATTQNLAAYAEIRKAGSGGGGGGSGGGSGGGGSSGLFVSTSTWNTPIPANATFVDEPALHGGGWFESGAYAIPVVRSSAADPLVHVQPINEQVLRGGSWGWTNAFYDLHIPAGITGATGTDGSLAIIDLDGTEYDFWQFRRDSTNTAHCESAAHTSTITGDGWGSLNPFLGAGIHAAGSSLTAGLIMGNELTQGINHTVVVSVRYDLCTNAPTGQAISADGSGAPLQEGQRYGIPPNVAMPGGLTLQQQNLWRALQKYGCFNVDVNGITPPMSISFWADIRSVPQADQDGVMASGFPPSGLGIIVNALRIVH